MTKLLSVAGLLLIVSVLGTATEPPAQTTQAPDRDASWSAWLDARATRFSGVVMIGHGSEVEATRAYGLAERDRQIPNRSQTLFNLGSINKTFTALAIAQLIQQRRVSLDDTLAKHLPDYPSPAATTITIRDLISHRSGIATFMRAEFGTMTVAEMVRAVAAQPLVFAPGERQEYSNGGYVVLGRVIEVVSGQSYADYIKRHIYEPAGMSTAGFLELAARRDDVAMGYAGDGVSSPPDPADPGSAPTVRAPARGNPAGGGYATATDLFRFATALRSGRLLDKQMTDYVTSGTFSGTLEPKFGFGLREQIVGSRRFIGNGGGAPGVNAEFRFEPAGGYTVVVLSNTSPPAATGLLRVILERLAGVESAPPPPPPGLGASLAPTRQSPAPGGIRSEIERLHEEMIATFRATPADVARFYTADARILGGGRRFAGDQIRSYWAQMPAGAEWQLEIVTTSTSSPPQPDHQTSEAHEGPLTKTECSLGYRLRSRSAREHQQSSRHQ